jgi:hypothetical protein
MAIEYCACVGINGDCDENGVVGVNDQSCFVDCRSGPGGGVLPGCETFDIDEDDDIDLMDWSGFQLFFAGP